VRQASKKDYSTSASIPHSSLEVYTIVVPRFLVEQSENSDVFQYL